MADDFILKKQNQSLDKLLLLFAISLNYGIFILVCPIYALLYRAQTYSWLSIRKSLLNPIVLAACQATFSTGLLATAINCIFGLVIAWVLVKLRFPGKQLLDIAVDLPFALPTSVGGLTLMTVYSDRGWMGPICSLLGLKVSFTRLGVLIAMIFVSLPFVVRTLQPILYSMEQEVEEAAWCLGASEWTTFWWIIFPSLTSSLLTGTTLAFSRAIGEYGSIVLVAGNIPKKDLVISVLIFQRLEQYDHQGAISIAVLVLLLSFIMLLTINSIQIWKRSFRK
jgi:sulfate transport system permease protein